MTGTSTGTGTRAGTGTVDLDDAWASRVFLMWHGAFAFLVLVVSLDFSADHVAWPGYAVLGALVVAYAALMVPGMTTESDVPLRCYAVVAVCATLALGYVDRNGSAILYAVFPQLFGALRARRIRYPVVFGLAAAAVLVGARHEGVGAAVVNVGLALLVSLLIGGCTQMIMREAERRGELVRELEATRADLERAHHESGVLAERQRLSHEIHDTLAQGFTSLLMLIQAADATLEKDPAASRQRLALAETTARDNLAEARALVAALAPAPLQGRPLDLALERVCARTGEELGLPVEVRILGVPRELPADRQVVLVRVAQEALSNVRKHAAAREVGVRLSYRAAGVLLEVQDDGRGFLAGGGRDAVAGVDGAGASYGLSGMRARVEQVRGTLEITSAPGEGTTVRVEIP